MDFDHSSYFDFTRHEDKNIFEDLRSQIPEDTTMGGELELAVGYCVGLTPGQEVTFAE